MHLFLKRPKYANICKYNFLSDSAAFKITTDFAFLAPHSSCSQNMHYMQFHNSEYDYYRETLCHEKKYFEKIKLYLNFNIYNFGQGNERFFGLGGDSNQILREIKFQIVNLRTNEKIIQNNRIMKMNWNKLIYSKILFNCVV